MGRAIVRQPQAFLLDEPLSNLDAKLRVGMRASLAQLHQRLGVTTVYVTHDQTEAMTLGQRVAVMRDGRFLQVDTPKQLYERPTNLFIAAFIGSPAMNLVDATVDGDGVRFGQFHVPVRRRPARPPGSASTSCSGSGRRRSRTRRSRPGLPTIRARIEVLEELGSDVHLFFHVDAAPISAEILEAAAGGGLPDGRALFTARVDAADGGAGRRCDRAGGRLRALPLLRSGDRRAAHARQRAGARGGPLTKQRETRESVLELIEPLAVGAAIPSERQLGVDLGVSRLTVRAALDELVREGYLVRRRGAGTFVAEPKVAKGFDVSSFSDDMRARGLDARQPHARPAGRAGRSAPRAHAPRLAVGADRLRQAAPPRRRRSDGDRAAARSRIARARPDGARTSRRTRSTSCSSNRYDLADRGGTQTVEPTVTNDEESAVLGVPLHSPALLFERITRASTGDVIEFTSSTYRGDRYRLVTELGVGGRPSQPLEIAPVAATTLICKWY